MWALVTGVQTCALPICVREVEMGDARVEGVAQQLALAIEGDVVAEVPPESERHRREVQSTGTHLPVVHRRVAIPGSGVRAMEVRDVRAKARSVGHPPTLALTPESNDPTAKPRRNGSVLRSEEPTTELQSIM